MKIFSCKKILERTPYHNQKIINVHFYTCSIDIHVSMKMYSQISRFTYILTSHPPSQQLHGMLEKEAKY